MRYCCTVLSVSDINKARSFYENIFGLEVCQDYGRNILFSCGLALQQDFDWLIGVSKEQVYKKPNNIEIVFEEHDFDGFLQKLNDYPSINFLGNVVEHDWGQRVIRFYDLDGHLIEVGEEMKMVIERFISDGMTLEEVSKRMDVSVDDLLKLLNYGDTCSKR
ncbi:VOC family protein [Bacteroides caecimuris]|uniref:VOC family protein n=2 Tax=Bacteroides TaxID=816 RepID=UPI0026494E36|nr:VOC family protein [Bacteroides caecimuris]